MILPSSFMESLANYPELTSIQRHWTAIRDEAIVSCQFSMPILDGRAASGLWKVFPLKSEPEDRIVISDEICFKNRKIVPRTVEILESIPSVQAYSFSFLPFARRKNQTASTSEPFCHGLSLPPKWWKFLYVCRWRTAKFSGR